ncbi:hypothetical protein NKH77_47545 [Streptomyces sp. M19]
MLADATALYGAGGPPDGGERPDGADTPAAVHEATGEALRLVRHYLDSTALGTTRLVALTEHGAAVLPDEVPGLAASAVRGC